MDRDTCNRSEVSSISSCTDAFEEMVVENPIREAMLIANSNNREAVGYLDRGMQEEAYQQLELGSKRAVELLKNPYAITGCFAHSHGCTSSSQHPALNLIVISLRGTSKMTDSAFVLRNVFSLDDAFLNKEALVAVILYNLAYLLHMRGLNDRVPLWKQTRDLQRAMQLYTLVRKLSEKSLRLEVPVLSMATLNNLGHVHYVQQDYAETTECWSALGSMLADLPEGFSVLNQRSMKLNVQLKDKLDAASQPQKRRRAV